MTIALPADAESPDYGPAILAAVSSGNYSMPFAKVTSSIPNHSATFFMSADALKVDGVRYGMGAYLMQQVADVLGCLLPTAKLRDLLYMQRNVTVEPKTASIVGIPIASTKTADMVRHSAAIDAAVAGKTGIIQTTGKPWILTNGLATHSGKACNYGWNVDTVASSWLGVAVYPPESDPSLPFRVIQQPGFAHGFGPGPADQADFSETATLVHRRCIVDGVDRDLADILVDAELAPLASHEGVLRLLRQPGVPVVACAVPSASPPSVASPARLIDSSLCPAPAQTPPPPTESPSNFFVWAAGIGVTAAAALLLYRYFRRRS